MIAIDIDPKNLAQLRTALKGMEKKLPRELAAAINATAKKVKLEAARELRKFLTVKVSILKKTISFKAKATPSRTRAKIIFNHGFPIPLKYFRARQLKRGGVTYKVNPAFNRPSIIRDAFIVKRYGDNVYRRKTEKRWPLEKQYGPSPKQAFEAGKIPMLAKKIAEQELPKQIQRRIRLIILREQGIVQPRKGN
jgi:hypothetical protein